MKDLIDGFWLLVVLTAMAQSCGQASSSVAAPVGDEAVVGVRLMAKMLGAKHAPKRKEVKKR